MLVTRALHWLLCVVLGGAAVHLAALVALPYVVMGRLVLEQKRDAGENVFEHSALPTAGVARASPPEPRSRVLDRRVRRARAAAARGRTRDRALHLARRASRSTPTTSSSIPTASAGGRDIDLVLVGTEHAARRARGPAPRRGAERPRRPDGAPCGAERCRLRVHRRSASPGTGGDPLAAARLPRPCVGSPASCFATRRPASIPASCSACPTRSAIAGPTIPRSGRARAPASRTGGSRSSTCRRPGGSRCATRTRASGSSSTARSTTSSSCASGSRRTATASARAPTPR